jgi:prepilin-type N-terminal cleavage/methylation domain-containing protein
MRRRAFTLIEVLLVLALMAAVAALTWPSVLRQIKDYRLRMAADKIRTEWCLARIDAMRTGCVYTFRRSGDGNHFSRQRESDNGTAAGAPQVQSQSQSLWPSQSPSQSPSQGPSLSAPSSAPPQAPGAFGVSGTYGAPGGSAASGVSGNAAAPQSDEKTLPEGVEFTMMEATTDAATGAEALEGSQDTVPDWSDPIFFYPDGTTSDAKLTLKNDQGRSIQMDLQGLTGAVDVGDILSADEEGKE